MTTEVGWEDYANCAGMETRFFHKDDNNDENYEEDAEIAKITDQICLTCPVIQQCLDKGMKGSEWGVWGGVYLSAGKVDKTRNSHKTKEVWKEWGNRVDLAKHSGAKTN